MRSSLIAVVASAFLAGGESDPAGTVSLQLEVGESAPVDGAPGANLLCDDPGIVAPDFGGDGGGFLLRAIQPGTTLCGLWLVGQKPGGLYRVTVTVKKNEAGPATVRNAGVDAG